MYIQKKRIGEYMVFLNEILGSGTYSKVYKGEIELTKEPVAVKIIEKVADKIVEKEQIQKEEYARLAFASQIQILKRLKSDNIIQFKDVHQSKNNYYLILELADGGTLRTRLREMGRFDQKATIKCLLQILNGFGELVLNGVTHRDLKPENILIKDNVLKIADFGFAKFSEGNNFLNTPLGTLVYMAPQILRQQRYTYKCDIWSLGVMTYEMIVGKIPWIFTEKTQKSIRLQILTREITIPKDINMSENMRQFILGCLQRDENKRFDREQVFLHPLFRNKFVQNFSDPQKVATKLSYIMSDLRGKILSNNMNLKKVLSKLEGTLTKEDLFKLLKYIDIELSEDDATFLIACMVKKGEYISVQDFKIFLTKYNCLILDEISLMTRIKRCLIQGNLDVNQLISNQKFPLNIKQFQQLMKQIDNSINKAEVEYVFKKIDLNNNGQLSKDQFHQGMLKIISIELMEQE